MTEARVEQVHEDRLGARDYLQQADDFFRDAALSGLTAASKVVLLHNATVAACDAILQSVGLRITGGDRAHVLRLETALGRLAGDTQELLERFDATRERRNEASYHATYVAEASAQDALEATRELLVLAHAFVG